MSEPHGTLGATVPSDGDYASGGADVPKAFRDFVDSIGAAQGKGKLLVAQNTGAAAWKAMKGDGTLAEDGTLTIADGVVTSRKFKPTHGIKALATKKSALAAAYEEVSPKLEITPSVASVLRITAFFDLGLQAGSTAATALGNLKVDGEGVGPTATLTAPKELFVRATVGMAYEVALTAAAHIIVLIALRTETAGATCFAEAGSTRFLYELIAS